MSATPAPGPADRPEWFYLRNRQKAGPFTLDQMRRLLETGELHPHDLVLRQGSEVWAAVSAVPDLAQAALQPASPPAITTTPGLASRATPDPEDWPGPEPLVARRGFWHWYRTHPGLVALLVVGLLLLALLPMLTAMFLYTRQMRLAEAMAQAQATQAEAQAVRAEMLIIQDQLVQQQREQEKLAETQRQAYPDRIQKADQAWKNKDLAAAGKHLDQTDLNSRGWEYDYLRRLVADGPGAAACRTLPEHDSPVHAVGFSPDGRMLASADGSAEKPGVVRLWDLEGKGEPRILKGHTGLIGCLAFSRDGKQLVTGSSDRTVKVWNIESGKMQLSVAGHEGSVTSVTFNRAGDELVSVGGGTIKVWRSDTGEESIKLEEANGAYHGVAFDPLAAASLDGTVKLWDGKSGRVNKVLGKMQDKPLPTALLCSYDSKCVWDLAVAGLDIKVWKIWKPNPGAEPPSWGAERAPFRALAFINWDRLATGAGDGAIRLWDSKTGKELFCLTGHNGPVTSLAFSPVSERLVSGSADGTIKVWEAVPP